MSDGNSIVNLGDISKPAVVLIEKISDLIGGYFKPYQIRRVARAEADAEIVKAHSEIEITELQQRAVNRFLHEEAKKQDNIESITNKALPYVREDANPARIEDDWITSFFDKCRLISDEQMQELWARILAGEANSPGSYSKRTISILSSLDKNDALLFKALCGFGWYVGYTILLIYSLEDSVYKDHEIHTANLEHLDDIGLISFSSLSGFGLREVPKYFRIFYYGTPIDIMIPDERNKEFLVGNAKLTRAGQDLAPICGSEPVPGYLDYVLNRWRHMGLIVSSPCPQHLAINNGTASRINDFCLEQNIEQCFL